MQGSAIHIPEHCYLNMQSFKTGNAYDQLETVSGQEQRFQTLYKDICDNQKRQETLHQILTFSIQRSKMDY